MGIFNWHENGPAFSVADTRALVEMALPELEVRLGERIWRTHTGIVSQSRLATEVTEACKSRSEPFSPKLLAGELGILDEDKDATEFILNVAEQSKLTILISGGQIYPQQAVKLLTAKLLELQNHTQVVIPSAKICSQLNISAQVLRLLVNSQSDNLILVSSGDAVALRSELEAHEKNFRSRLSEAASPVDLVALEPDELTRSVLIAKTGPFEGSFNASVSLFTPRKFTNNQREACAAKLKSSGFLPEAALAEFDVKDTAKFARKHDAIVSSGYVVLESYIEEQATKIKTTLASTGFFDLKSLDLPQVVRNAVDVKIVPGYTHYLVRPSLESRVADEVSGKLHSEAVEATSKLQDLRPDSSERALVAKVSLPDALKVQNLLELGDSTFEKEVARKIVEKVRAKYLATARLEIEKRLEAVRHETDLKISVYLNGVLSVSDEATRALLYQEWEQYVISAVGTAPGPIDTAKESYAANSEEELREAAAQVVAKVKKQLKNTASKPKNAALVLHLAVVIYHALKSSGRDDAALKITGKLVPKILKEFTFPDSFTELRKTIRDPSPDLVEAVKTCALDI